MGLENLKSIYSDVDVPGLTGKDTTRTGDNDDLANQVSFNSDYDNLIRINKSNLSNHGKFNSDYDNLNIPFEKDSLISFANPSDPMPLDINVESLAETKLAFDEFTDSLYSDIENFRFAYGVSVPSQSPTKVHVSLSGIQSSVFWIKDPLGGDIFGASGAINQFGILDDLASKIGVDLPNIPFDAELAVELNPFASKFLTYEESLFERINNRAPVNAEAPQVGAGKPRYANPYRGIAFQVLGQHNDPTGLDSFPEDSKYEKLNHPYGHIADPAKLREVGEAIQTGKEQENRIKYSRRPKTWIDNDDMTDAGPYWGPYYKTSPKIDFTYQDRVSVRTFGMPGLPGLPNIGLPNIGLPGLGAFGFSAAAGMAGAFAGAVDMAKGFASNIEITNPLSIDPGKIVFQRPPIIDSIGRGMGQLWDMIPDINYPHIEVDIQWPPGWVDDFNFRPKFSDINWPYIEVPNPYPAIKRFFDNIEYPYIKFDLSGPDFGEFNVDWPHVVMPDAIKRFAAGVAEDAGIFARGVVDIAGSIAGAGASVIKSIPYDSIIDSTIGLLGGVYEAAAGVGGYLLNSAKNIPWPMITIPDINWPHIEIDLPDINWPHISMPDLGGGGGFNIGDITSRISDFAAGAAAFAVDVAQFGAKMIQSLNPIAEFVSPSISFSNPIHLSVTTYGGASGFISAMLSPWFLGARHNKNPVRIHDIPSNLAPVAAPLKALKDPYFYLFDMNHPSLEENKGVRYGNSWKYTWMSKDSAGVPAEAWLNNNIFLQREEFIEEKSDEWHKAADGGDLQHTMNRYGLASHYPYDIPGTHFGELYEQKMRRESQWDDDPNEMTETGNKVWTLATSIKANIMAKTMSFPAERSIKKVKRAPPDPSDPFKDAIIANVPASTYEEIMDGQDTKLEHVDGHAAQVDEDGKPATRIPYMAHGGENNFYPLAAKRDSDGKVIEEQHTMYPFITTSDVNDDANTAHKNILETPQLGMPVYFVDMRDRKIIAFKGYLEGISDAITGTWNEEDYIGRSESVYTYEKGSRSISFTLKTFAHSILELDAIYAKLRRLTSFCYPEYHVDSIDSRQRMKPPLVKLRVGELFGNSRHDEGVIGAMGLLGFIESVTHTFPDESPWEHRQGMRVPKHIESQIDFKVIHDTPAEMSTPFYGYQSMQTNNDIGIINKKLADYVGNLLDEAKGMLPAGPFD